MLNNQRFNATSKILERYAPKSNQYKYWKLYDKVKKNRKKSNTSRSEIRQKKKMTSVGKLKIKTEINFTYHKKIRAKD